LLIRAFLIRLTMAPAISDAAEILRFRAAQARSASRNFSTRVLDIRLNFG